MQSLCHSIVIAVLVAAKSVKVWIVVTVVALVV